MRNIDGTLRKPNLKVYEELPHGVLEETPLFFRQTREARGYVDNEYKHFYYCPNCEGWIEGWPVAYMENNLASWALAGRSGRVEDCERCGYELDFMGIVS